MPSYNIELNNHPVKGSDEHSLLLRITVDRKHSRIKLDYSVYPDYFNKNPRQNLYVRAKHPRAARINKYLDDKIQEAKEAAERIAKAGKLVTAANIKKELGRPKVISFYELTEKKISNMKKNSQVSNAQRYSVLLNKIKEMRHDKDLYLQEVDKDFLEKYCSYCKKLGNSDSTIHANMRIIRTMINEAISSGILKYDANPFLSYKLKLGSKGKERLTAEEIASIEKLEFPESTLLFHVKNVFLFSFYCAGIRVSDLLMMKWSNIVKGRLVYRMYKTKMDHSVKLWDKPLAILEYYRENEDPENFIFPFFDNRFDYTDPAFLHNQISAKTALINKYLKKIATLAEIDKRITTHTARHSFADIARQKTNNLYNLSKTLGHSSLKITEAYLASFDEKAVDDTLDEVFG